MIKGKDIYEVLSALVPLYVAMVLGFGSVRWWKIFTPEQCSGINRFVAVFAVPFLSFNFIASNNIYAMNYKFLAGDSLQKVVILIFLFLWNMTRFGSLEWSITLFSLFTLPNTLVMGIPLLRAMYGDFSSSLMVQIVFLQTCIWVTLLLALFEYRGAKILVTEQFPETAGSISTLKADSDVNSLSGREPIQADAEIGQDGKLHVVFRRSNSTLSMLSNDSHNNIRTQNFPSITPRESSLSGVEIFSVHSSRDQTPRNSSFSNQIDNNMQRSNSQNGAVLGSSTAPKQVLSGSASIGSHRRRDSIGGGGGAPLHMFVWSPSASPITDMNMVMRHHGSMNRGSSASEIGTIDPSKVVHVPHETNASKDGHESIEIEEKATYPLSGSMKKVNTEEEEEDDEEGNNGERKQEMPSASVFLRLVLIMVWRKLIRNPNTWASLLGLTWSLIAFRYNIKMPTIIKGSFTIVSNTGMGMAMFSLGLFMALQPKIIACGKKWAIISMAIRFLGGPAVIAACSTAIGIRGVLLHVEIVQASLPQAIIPFVFAKEYNLHADIFSTAVIFGMVVALPVTIIYYVLLGL